MMACYIVLPRSPAFTYLHTKHPAVVVLQEVRVRPASPRLPPDQMLCSLFVEMKVLLQAYDSTDVKSFLSRQALRTCSNGSISCLRRVTMQLPSTLHSLALT
jgi:hypothetical protein